MNNLSDILLVPILCCILSPAQMLSEMGLVLILNIIIYVNYFWDFIIREKRTRWTDSTGLN